MVKILDNDNFMTKNLAYTKKSKTFRIFYLMTPEDYEHKISFINVKYLL